MPKSRGDQERTGFKGESLVYQKLLDDPSIQKVKWVSENAKKAEINPEGSAGKGYDIEYIDTNGNKKFVEVKTSKAEAEDGIRFFLSDNEYRFAQEHEDSYSVYYVCGVEGNKPQIYVFDNLFINQEINRDCFSVDISCQYMVTAEI